jgi:hypothetical protein
LHKRKVSLLWAALGKKSLANWLYVCRPWLERHVRATE